jgi:hypothetical protein
MVKQRTGYNLMIIDRKIIIIIVQGIIIIVLGILLVRPDSTDEKEDAYLKQLLQQNAELELQLGRLKNNYVEIGLIDSVQTANMDSLISASRNRLSALQAETQTYRATLEEMKSKEWKKLSDKQKTKEIDEALNFLRSHEQ